MAGMRRTQKPLDGLGVQVTVELSRASDTAYTT